MLTSNFLVVSDLPPLLSLANRLYNGARPRMSVSLLETCMTAMGLLPVNLENLSVPKHLAFRAYDLLAASYHGSDSTHKAGTIYEYLVAVNKEKGGAVNAELACNYAVSAFHQGDYYKARELFDEALAAAREMEPPNLKVMAQIFIERANLAGEDVTKDDGDPIEYTQRAIFILTTLEKKLHKDEVDERKEIEDMISISYLTMGKLQLERNKNSHAGAIRSLRQSLKYDPSNVETISTMMHAEDMPSYNDAVPPITKATHSSISSTIEFVTFASDPEKCELQRLLHTAKSNGVDFTVLGAGYPTAQWKNGLKLQLLADFLEGLPENRLVVVVDGYDVVLSGGRNDFFDRYAKVLTLSQPYLQNKADQFPVIFQADYTFYCPLNDQDLSASIARSYPSSPTRYKYLSSGGIASESSVLSKLVGSVLSKYDTEEWEKKSDQSLFIRYLVDTLDESSAVPIVVDHYQIMFGGNGGNFRKDFEVEGGKIKHKRTGTFPVSMHTPGRKKNQREMVDLRDAGWEVDLIEC